jgi:hypothetical protein
MGEAVRALWELLNLAMVPKWNGIPIVGLAELAIFDFIAGWYNQHRRHSALGFLSPAEVERRTSSATLVA